MKCAIKALSMCLLLSAAMVWAKDKVILPDACGDESLLFKVEDNGSHPPLTTLEPGKALIVIGHIKQGPGTDLFNIRIGMDGAWTGALNSTKNDYFAFSVSPSEHHFCATFGAHKLLGNPSMMFSFASPERIQTLTLNVEAGRIYYLEAKQTVIPNGNSSLSSFSLGQLSEDDGKFMVKSRDYATSTPKK